MDQVRRLGAFTLLELLVVVAIIAILIGLLAPVLEKATERARLAACGENLHQISVGLYSYAGEFNNSLPIGPAGPSAIDPARTWNSVGSHQVWIAASRQYKGLGLLTSGGWLKDARVLICPSDDEPNAKLAFMANLGSPATDAYCSYAFRQLDQTTSDRITVPGVNGLGASAKGVLFDWQSEGAAPYARNSHDYNEYLNVLYLDGHVQGFPQSASRFLAQASDYSPFPAAYLKRLDQLWVTADYAESGRPEDTPKLP